MKTIMLSLKDVYNIMEASGNVNALDNLKEIIESKDIEIRNKKETIHNRNKQIKDLRKKLDRMTFLKETWERDCQTAEDEHMVHHER